mmetsp:Transcript_15269/g.22417  ORF Transcript_15269/g.22417 Transcript_15269/m.22417 type:complete len:184 (-) Transcript_15269:191-742(-)
MFRCIEQEGRRFRDQGFGAYSFLRDDLSKIAYLPCLDRAETAITHDKSSRTSECVLFTEYEPRMTRKVVVNVVDGTLSIQDCAFDPGYAVVEATPMSVLECLDDNGVHELVEYDLATGRALRTLSVDAPPHCQIEDVLVSHERGELFLILKDDVGGVHSIYAFRMPPPQSPTDPSAGDTEEAA